jgi:hypothetical protein
MQTVEVNVVRFFDPDEVEGMARKCGFVHRRSPVTGMRFLLTFTTGLLNTPDGTLAQLAAFLGATCGATVSAQAVDERINSMAREFIGLCLRRALEMAAAIPRGAGDVLNRFTHVYILDSTNFELRPALAPHFKGNGGGASPAAMRIQLAFDYRTDTMHVEIGDVRLSDTDTFARLIEVQALPMDGVCLFLTDLGYFRVATFGSIRSRQDWHFLSKLQFGVGLANADGTDLDLKRLLKKAPPQFDVPVMMGQTACRLVGKRLPDDVVNRRIRKANEASQSKSRQITDLYRLFLHYALFVTSLPPEFGMVQLFALYRIRWQVELAFKVWKSILAIHHVHSAKPDRVLCEVYGKLIVAVLTTCLGSAARAFLDGLVISPHKVARHVRAVATNWALAITAGTASHSAFLKTLSRLLARFCRKTRQKRKPTLEEILSQALPSHAEPPAPLPVTALA